MKKCNPTQEAINISLHNFQVDSITCHNARPIFILPGSMYKVPTGTRKWKYRTFIGPILHKLYPSLQNDLSSIHTKFSSGIQIFTWFFSFTTLKSEKLWWLFGLQRQQLFCWLLRPATHYPSSFANNDKTTFSRKKLSFVKCEEKRSTHHSS